MRNALVALVLATACGGKAPRVPAATCIAVVDDARAALRNAETWTRRIVLAAALVAAMVACPSVVSDDEGAALLDGGVE